MAKIVDYLIVVISTEDSYGLGHYVKKYIKDGWQPYGQPFLADNYHSPKMAQAMVKYEE